MEFLTQKRVISVTILAIATMGLASCAALPSDQSQSQTGADAGAASAPASSSTPKPSSLYAGNTTLTIAGDPTYSGYTFSVQFEISAIDVTTTPAQQIGQTRVRSDVSGNFVVTNTTPGRDYWPGYHGVGAYPSSWVSLTVGGYYPSSSPLCAGKYGIPAAAGCVVNLGNFSQPYLTPSTVEKLAANQPTPMVGTSVESQPGDTSNFAPQFGQTVDDATATVLARELKAPSGFVLISDVGTLGSGGGWGTMLAGACNLNSNDGGDAMGPQVPANFVATQQASVPQLCK